MTGIPPRVCRGHPVAGGRGENVPLRGLCGRLCACLVPLRYYLPEKDIRASGGRTGPGSVLGQGRGVFALSWRCRCCGHRGRACVSPGTTNPPRRVSVTGGCRWCCLVLGVAPVARVPLFANDGKQGGPCRHRQAGQGPQGRLNGHSRHDKGGEGNGPHLSPRGAG